MDSKRIKDFLAKIAELESTSGKNTAHRTIAGGIQSGDTAIGKYGLMPNTINEFVKRTGKNKELLKMSGEEKKLALESNPDLEEQLAAQVAEHVLANQGGNEPASAYSWLYGHNLDSNKIIKRKYQDDPYVKKFKELPDMNKELPTQLEDKISNPEFDQPSPLLPKDILESKANMSLKDKSDLFKHLQKLKGQS